MQTIWTCPICGSECVDDAATRCIECERNVHSKHVKEHRCTECRKRLGIDAPDNPAMYYVDENRQLRLMHW